MKMLGDFFAICGGLLALVLMFLITRACLTETPCHKRVCTNGARPMYLDMQCICAERAE